MTVRVLLIGAGGFAASHARAMQAASQVELVGVVDVRADAAREFATRRDLPWWTDIEEAQHHVGANVASIVTPTVAHADAARKALGAGLNVLIEKPVCLRLEDVEEIRDLAGQQRLVVDVVSQRRLQTGIAIAHGAVTNGAIGPISSAICQSNVWRGPEYFRSAPWRGDPARGGGNLLNQGMHALDLLLWFMGEPRDVVARAKASRLVGVHVDEVIQGVIDFDGAIASMQASLVTRVEPSLHLQIFGDLGTVTVDDHRVRLVRWDEQRARELTDVWESGDVGSALTRQYERLSGLLSGADGPGTGLDSGALALRTALAMLESAADSGARVGISR